MKVINMCKKISLVTNIRILVAIGLLFNLIMSGLGMYFMDDINNSSTLINRDVVDPLVKANNLRSDFYKLRIAVLQTLSDYDAQKMQRLTSYTKLFWLLKLIILLIVINMSLIEKRKSSWINC
ncbi:MCP four helix bundle domain-containing protein [Brevibacillus laterosporus]